MCSTVVESVEYSFTVDLYERIVPEQCEVLVKCSEVIIGLKKYSRGLWARITRQCHKHFAKSDFSFFFDDDVLSSENEDHERDEPPLALLSRKLLSFMLLFCFYSYILLLMYIYNLLNFFSQSTVERYHIS